MRRLLALVTLLAFAAATAAPAVAGCRTHAADNPRCCAPAPSRSFCAPGHCDLVAAGALVARATAQPRGFILLAQPLLRSAAQLELWSRPLAPPSARLRVGLHLRAAPRLPLRV